MQITKLPRSKGADHAVEFASNLCLVADRLGEPVQLARFQEFILRTLFHTNRAGRRIINRSLLFLPRKQSKTWLAAVCVLIWLLGLGKKGQQVLSIANDEKQAKILFSTCVDICRQLGLEAAGVVEIVESNGRITVPSKFSFYQSLSSTSSTKTGYRPNFCLIDEYQDIADPELLKNFTTAFGTATDWLTLYISTGGTNRNKPAFAEYEYAKKIQNGDIKNPHYAAFIWEAPEECEDIFDEKVWAATMPAWDSFLNQDFIRSEFELAKHIPAKESECRQYYLNQWLVGSGTKWIKDIDWMQNASEPLHDAPFYTLGIDLASVEDTSSAVLFGQNSQGLFDVISYHWVCEAQIDRRITAEYDYKRWKEDGLLIATPGNAQEQPMILDDIIKICSQYNVTKIAIDRHGTQWFGPTALARGLPIVEFGQSYADMNEPLKRLNKMVLNKQLCHGGHKIMRWMCSNSRLQRGKLDEYRIVKEISEEKCDGMVALAMACGVYPFVEATNFHEKDFLMSLLPNKPKADAAP